MTHLLTGFLTGLGLIVAIGSQNAFVLRQGLLRHHVGLVVVICALGDIVLELAGVLGMGAVVSAHPDALRVIKWLGAAYLVWFGLNSFKNARHAGSLSPADAPPMSRRAAAATVAGLTFLNPHVYLDVTLIGSIANSHGLEGRWWYWAGMVAGSALWFSTLGFGARRLAPLFARPRSWQLLDAAIAVVMVAIGLGLILSG